MGSVASAQHEAVGFTPCGRACADGAEGHEQGKRKRSVVLFLLLLQFFGTHDELRSVHAKRGVVAAPRGLAGVLPQTIALTGIGLPSV